MNSHCDFHPTQPAWWQCPNCGKALCPQCIGHRKSGFQDSESVYLCPLCNVVATRLDASNIVEPFWKRLHKCFAYPFSSMPSIALIFGLAALSVFFNRPGFFPAVFRFLLWALMVKYAYEALRSTAEGKFAPPPLSRQVLSDNFHIVFKQIALYLAFSLVYQLMIASMGPFIRIVYGVGMAVVLPAMIMVLAINDDLGRAMNPLYFIGSAVRIGRGYWLLFLFLTILGSAPGVLGQFVIRFMPETLQVFFWTAVKNFYTLVAYHLMGYVILQYHARLGHDVDMERLLASLHPCGLPQSPNTARSDSMLHAEGLLKEIGPMIQEGDLDGAIALIQKRTALDIDDMDLSERYIHLLKMRNRTEELLEYAPRHLELLVSAADKAKAVDHYLFCSEKIPGFAPPALVLFKTGSWLNEKGKARESIQAFSLLTKNHPQDSLVPKAYFRAAQILHEQLMSTDKAKKILAALIRKFPDHDVATFARKYLETI